jgi:hypothetical protein
MGNTTTASDSQTDTKTYLPLVLVKNALVGNLFSTGILDSASVKTLVLPNSNYSYLLKIVKFENQTNSSGNVKGAYKYLSTSYSLISNVQTSIDISSNGLAFYEAQLIIKQ